MIRSLRPIKCFILLLDLVRAIINWMPYKISLLIRIGDNLQIFVSVTFYKLLNIECSFFQ